MRLNKLKCIRMIAFIDEYLVKTIKILETFWDEFLVQTIKILETFSSIWAKVRGRLKLPHLALTLLMTSYLNYHSIVSNFSYNNLEIGLLSMLVLITLFTFTKELEIAESSKIFVGNDKIKVLYLVLISVYIISFCGFKSPFEGNTLVDFKCFDIDVYTPCVSMLVGPVLCTGLILEILAFKGKEVYLRNLGYHIHLEGLPLPLLITSISGAVGSKGVIPIFMALNLLALGSLFLFDQKKVLSVGKELDFDITGILPFLLFLDACHGQLFWSFSVVSLVVGVACYIEHLYGNVVVRWCLSISRMTFCMGYMFISYLIVDQLGCIICLILGFLLSVLHWTYAEVPKITLKGGSPKEVFYLTVLKVVNFLCLKPFQGYIVITFCIIPLYLSGDLSPFCLDPLVLFRRGVLSLVLILYTGSEKVCSFIVKGIPAKKVVGGDLGNIYLNFGSNNSSIVVKTLLALISFERLSQFYIKCNITYKMMENAEETKLILRDLDRQRCIDEQERAQRAQEKQNTKESSEFIRKQLQEAQDNNDKIVDTSLSKVIERAFDTSNLEGEGKVEMPDGSKVEIILKKKSNG